MILLLKTLQSPVRLTFTTDGSNSERGFRLRYSLEERNFCDPNPCENEGECAETTAGFECACYGSKFYFCS